MHGHRPRRLGLGSASPRLAAHRNGKAIPFYGAWQSQILAIGNLMGKLPVRRWTVQLLAVVTVGEAREDRTLTKRINFFTSQPAILSAGNRESGKLLAW